MADPTESRGGIDHLLQTNGNYRPKGDNRALVARKRRLAEISNVTDDDYGSSPTLKSSLPSIEQNISQESTAGEELISAFQPNDRCFAGSGGTGYVYLATIKQIAQLSYCDESEGVRWKYLVHFNGWNSRYDQWMTEEKVFPDNEHYRAMAEKSQEELLEIEQNRKEKKSQAEKEKKRNVDRRQSHGSTSQTEELGLTCTLPYFKNASNECVSTPRNLQRVKCIQ